MEISRDSLDHVHTQSTTIKSGLYVDMDEWRRDKYNI